MATKKKAVASTRKLKVSKSFEDFVKLDYREAFFTYVRSSFPIIVIPTREVDRSVQSLIGLAQEWNHQLSKKNLPEDMIHLKTEGFDIRRWDCYKGWHGPTGDDLEQGTEEPIPALSYLVNRQQPLRSGFYIMENLHLWFNDNDHDFPVLMQLLREHHHLGKQEARTIFMVGDFEELPPVIEHLAVIIDFPLPTREELEEYIREYVDRQGFEITDKDIVGAADAAAGMTTHEVESAICVSLVKSEGTRLSRKIMFAEKAKAVKRTGLLEHIPTTADLNSTIGGLDYFKEWLHLVSHAFTDMEGAREYGLPIPKGCLVAGISGTGKTASAKATASLFDVPLFRLDIGRVFGGLVGETERKTRQLIQLMEAVSPCVILMDEVEKSLAGMGGESQDSGVSQRLMSNLLYWLQEKTVPVYMIATANEVGKLPPEMMRKGRFDELWFVDLPSKEEREQILKIHIERTGRDIKNYAGYEKLADKPTAGFTGAEIEAVVGQAMFTAFADKKREFTLADIREAVKNTVPLIKTKYAEIEALRNWANQKARIANFGEVVKKEEIRKPLKGTNLYIDRKTSPRNKLDG